MNRSGTLPCCLVLAVGSLLASPTQAGEPAKEDAFLDHPFPASVPWETLTDPPPGFPGPKKTFQMLHVPSFWGGVQLLGKMSGKTVRLPEGLGEWPDERSESNWGISLGAANRKTVRELFESLCLNLGLIWHYDAKADVINLEPLWRRDDSRSGKALVGVLLGTPPVEWTKLPQDVPNRVGGKSMSRDPWRLAFDALLSRSENFPSAGVLRLYHDTHGHERGMSPMAVANLFTGTLLDFDGARGILVLNGQESMTNKEDPADVAYYLFDEEGRFIRGGVYAINEGWTGAITEVQAEGDHGITVAVGQGSFASNSNFFHFALVKGDLVLQGSTDASGKVMTADETRTTSHARDGDSVRLKYSVSPKADP